MAAAEGRSYFCPNQPDLTNVNHIWIDIRGGGRHFRKVFKSLKEREKKIAPFEVEVGGFRVHATPLDHPKDKDERSSFHILRLWDSKESRYRVDFLIQDTDLYFVGFRHQAEGVWGKWYTFNGTDEKVVKFLDATEIVELKLSYPNDTSWVTPGGDPASFKEIFYQFRNFQTLERITNRFKRAAYSVMVIFCESRRLRSLSNEVFHRIDNQLPPMQLSECQFEIIRKWSSASGIVLEAYKANALDLGEVLPSWWLENAHLKSLKTISCLIGLQGELLILKFNRRYVRDNDENFNFEKLRLDSWSAMVPDWDFIIY